VSALRSCVRKDPRRGSGDGGGACESNRSQGGPGRVQERGRGRGRGRPPRTRAPGCSPLYGNRRIASSVVREVEKCLANLRGVLDLSYFRTDSDAIYLPKKEMPRCMLVLVCELNHHVVRILVYTPTLAFLYNSPCCCWHQGVAWVVHLNVVLAFWVWQFVLADTSTGSP
jgi:hypothetical protein